MAADCIAVIASQQAYKSNMIISYLDVTFRSKMPEGRTMNSLPCGPWGHQELKREGEQAERQILKKITKVMPISYPIVTVFRSSFSKRFFTPFNIHNLYFLFAVVMSLLFMIYVHLLMFILFRPTLLPRLVTQITNESTKKKMSGINIGTFGCVRPPPQTKQRNDPLC